MGVVQQAQWSGNRRLFAQVLETVEAQQLWIADRNMCTLDFLSGIFQRQASFVIREHQNLPWTAIAKLKSCGQVEGGELWAQPIEIQRGEETAKLRRIVLRLTTPSRHGDGEIVVLTNLPIHRCECSTSHAIVQRTLASRAVIFNGDTEL